MLFIKTPHILVLFCIGYGYPVWPQNLVLNPSFEAFTSCPKALGQVTEFVDNWSASTLGTTDYFNSCSSSMGVPDNFNGSQMAYDGVGYVGLYMYAPEDYREYVQATLSVPLEKGKKYTLSFYISLAEKSDSYIGAFGVLFSEKPVRIPIKKELSKLHLSKLKDNAMNLIEIKDKNGFRDSEKWVLLSMTVIAKGRERYLNIGNFKSNATTPKNKIKKVDKERGAYYYIDHVELKPANQTYANNSFHEVNTIFFPSDVFELSEADKTKIEQIYANLQDHPGRSVSIAGHTDAEGNKAYNEVLSRKRAKSVADYLLQIGLPDDRLQWQGYGSAQPVMDNATEKGREGNRRVEIALRNREK
jgi:outer membrane protein OmpA-like peptidoglycan-associated protein